jgi:2-polyprenyl-3-methyl-5-hydroxy-6-metoxy-1,4-benzoquinol methylase
MIGISENYRRLDPAEVPALATELADAWKDQSIPQLQYDMAVKDELEAMRRGEPPCAPFLALLKCMFGVSNELRGPKSSLLDVGASAGYHSEVLAWNQFKMRYTAVDFSPAFKQFAERTYPGIKYDVGDARALPYADSSFDIVLHGAVLMHCLEYEKATQEAARVASQYVIFHRTPIVNEGPMQFWEKTAYGVPCVEIHFNEYELLNLFEDFGLDVVHEELVVKAADYSHKTYLCAKR